MTDFLQVRRARFAIATVFFVHGFTFGSWVPHVPLAKDQLAVGDGALGMALLSLALGAIIAMPLTALLIGRYGSAAVTIVTGFGFCLSLAGITAASTFGVFLLAGLVFGAFAGSLDVAMNAHGLLVERKAKSATMSLFHGFFSLGATAGAFGGAGALHYMTPALHTVAAITLCLVLHMSALRFLLSTSLDRGQAGPALVLPTRPTLVLGALCFIALMAEGAVIDWSAIMLREKFAVNVGTAALGYAAFSAGMTVSRLIGDPLRTRLGSTWLVGLSAGLTSAALLAALWVPSISVSIVAFGIAGLGIGNLAPVLFAGGGRLEPEAPGRGIAAVTTLGYAGFLLGPPLIGFLSEATTLPIALTFMAFGVVVIALSARRAGVADGY